MTHRRLWWLLTDGATIVTALNLLVFLPCFPPEFAFYGPQRYFLSLEPLFQRTTPFSFQNIIICRHFSLLQISRAADPKSWFNQTLSRIRLPSPRATTMRHWFLEYGSLFDKHTGWRFDRSVKLATFTTWYYDRGSSKRNCTSNLWSTYMVQTHIYFHLHPRQLSNLSEEEIDTGIVL